MANSGHEQENSGLTTYCASAGEWVVADPAAVYGAEYPHREITARVINAAIAVHRELGPGFVEPVYEEALCCELEAQGIAFERQKRIELFYRGKRVGLHRLDLVVEGLVVVEIKAVEQLSPVHRAQALSYLRATGLEIALLLNFAKPTLREGIVRVVCSTRKPSALSAPSAPLR